MTIREFGQALAQALQTRMPDIEFSLDKEGERIEVHLAPDKTGEIRLATFFYQHQQGRPVEQIADFFLRFVQAAQQPVQPFAQIKDRLIVHLIHGEAQDGQCARPAVPGLTALLVEDFPDHVRHVLKDHLGAIGETEEVLWEVARLNTVAKTPEPTRHPGDNGQEILVWEGYDLAPDYAWQFARQHAKAAFIAADKTLAAVVLDPTPENIAGLARVAAGGYLTAPEAKRLSPLVYLLEGGEVAQMLGAVPMPMPAQEDQPGTAQGQSLLN